MTVIALVLAFMATAYVAAAPDQKTLATSRGTAGALKAAGKAAGRQLGSDLRAGRPARPPSRTGRFLGGLWRGLLRGGQLTGRAVGSGIAAAPEGYRQGVDGARTRRGLPPRYAGPTQTLIDPVVGSDPEPDSQPATSGPADEGQQTTSGEPVNGSEPARPTGPDSLINVCGPDVPTGKRGPDGEADRRFFALRNSGYRGPIDQTGAPGQWVGPVFRPMVCPECGEPVVARPPRRWTPANGPRPPFSHTDGEPLCPVVGPVGYRPATPEDLDGNPVPNQPTDHPAAPAGGDPSATSATTTKENTPMSTTTSGFSGGDVGTIRAGELATIDDLEMEVQEASDVVESLLSQLQGVVEWLTGLADRYTAAPFGTKGMRAAVGSIGESVPDVNELVTLQESLNGLQNEIEEAAALTEVAEALDAEGQVEAFRTA